MKKKKFDCLAMKYGIQKRLSQQWAGLTDTERRDAIHRDLETSLSPIGNVWRQLMAREFTAASANRSYVAEPSRQYLAEKSKPGKRP